MRQLLKYLAIFILPIVVIGICFEISLRKIPNVYFYKKNYLDKNSNQIKVLLLGNSHIYYGINPEYYSLNAFNASSVSQSLDYDWEILNKYNNKWDSLKYVIVAVDYFSLFSKLEASVEAWRVKNYEIYFGINKSYKIHDHSEILSNNLKTNFSRLYRFYFKNENDITCSKLGWGTGNSSRDKKDLKKTGKISAERHTIKNDQYFNENIKILETIIEAAKAKGVEVILLSSPAYKTYTQNLDKYQLSRTIDAVNKIVNSSSNVIYLNLLTDDEFTENDFYDADHLNEFGTKKLSLKIDSLLFKIERNNNKQNTLPKPEDVVGK